MGAIEPILQDFHDRVDASQVLVQRCATDLLFHHRVPPVDVAAHLILKLAVILAWVVVATGRVNEYFVVGLAIAISLGQQLEQGRAVLGQRLEAMSAHPVFTAHLAPVLRSMALDGRGIAWLPRTLIADDLAAGRLLVAADAWLPAALGSKADSLAADSVNACRFR